MYKKHKRLMIALFMLLFVCSMVFRFNIKTIGSDILTVISIALGFYIAVIAILFGSKITKVLYETVDKENPVNTQLHSLLSYFQSGMYIGVLTIIIVLTHSLFGSTSIYHKIPQIPIIISSVSIGLFAVNMVIMMLIFVFLKNALIKEIENQKKRK